ncbi:MAG TPA: phytanoyl-CoA dioxygenase family protein, partial [Burkholderiales bacterium]|nr:phytanoyl-CoA dioxygenase family protein [Burkholderiales bacterium]
MTIDIETHVANMNRDGYTVIEDFLDAPRLAAIREGARPHFGRHRGRNAFEGFTTERIYTLVGRGRVFEDIAEDPRLLALVGRFLQPNFLLSASQAINIYPGEAKQGLHHDDSFYKVPRPR